MIINFTKLSPGGNDTIIVQTPVASDKRAPTACELMNRLGGEQVGYLALNPQEGVDARLDMMGGELCINALRSAATVLASNTSKTNIRLLSSGTCKIFECNCKASKDGFNTSISFEITPKITKLDRNITFVQLDGISHLLCELDSRESIGDPLTFFQQMRKKYDKKLTELPAFGVIPFQCLGDEFRIYPVVYVRATDSVIAETGCGSGSVALAALLKERNPETESINIIQPSGTTYDVKIRKQNCSVRVELESPVKILCKDVVNIPEKL